MVQVCLLVYDNFFLQIFMLGSVSAEFAGLLVFHKESLVGQSHETWANCLCEGPVRSPLLGVMLELRGVYSKERKQILWGQS